MARTTKKLSLNYTLVDDLSGLNNQERALVKEADNASELAYAPYSRFRVGAAALLESGLIIKGSNKENASFPAGICAERNALHTISDTHPGVIIKAMAIAAAPMDFTLDAVLAPCGICRQVLCETEKFQNHPIKLIFQHSADAYVIIDGCDNLLPFHFYLSELKK